MNIEISYVNRGFIGTAAIEAVQIATEKNAIVTFVFNEIELDVRPKSLPEDIYIQYDLKCKIRRLKSGYSD